MAELSFERGLEVLESRFRRVRIAIAGFIAVSLATAAGQTAEIAGAAGLAGSNSNPAPLMVLSVIYLAYAAIFVVTVVLVAMWIYRAHANVRAAGAGPLEVSPGWAVGWFFVPIASLFKPFQAMRELWNASLNTHDRYAAESDPKLKVWWGCWIVGNLLANIGARAMFRGGETGQAASTVLDVVSGLLLIAAAWFLLQIVATITAAQRSTLGVADTFA